MNNFVWKSILTKSKRADTTRPASESFVKSEDGLMTLLALGLIMVVFATAGFAVDIMRFDHERARLQYSLDRAVLAAADLEQDLCPKVVIESYLEKEGLKKYLVGDPIVTPDLCGSQAVTVNGYRRVEASAQMDVKMHFMQWWNVDHITTSVVSVAEEAIGNVEISLVLDVSGSMNNNNRLTTLKLAAQDFVQEMVDKTEDGKLSISIVPYATQVSLPDYLMNELSTFGTNDHANCINFTSPEFSTSAFDLDMIRERTMHFTPWGTYDRRPDGLIVYSEVCENSPNREIMVLQKDADVLKQKIADFSAAGNTSIDLGVKWGLTLLDDSFRPVIAKLAANGDVPAEFATRPASVATGDTMKVMVLMTDGSNTTQYWVNEPYRSGQANVWWNDDEKIYSYFDVDNNNFIWPEIPTAVYDYDEGWYWVRGSRQGHAYGNGNYRQYRCRSYSSYYGACYDVDYDTYEDIVENGTAISLTWPQLWERTTRREIRDMLRSAYGWDYGTDWYNAAVSTSSRSQKDPRVEAMCAKAKEEDNVVIFTIALEAPSAGKSILKKCQSDDGAYYEATPTNLPDVFASIGSSIRNLRLTQ